MKICPLGADLFHAEGKADGQAERKRKYATNSEFLQLCERAQKLCHFAAFHKIHACSTIFLQNSAEFHENTTDCLVRT
jgi:hypothetical protein